MNPERFDGTRRRGVFPGRIPAWLRIPVLVLGLVLAAGCGPGSPGAGEDPGGPEEGAGAGKETVTLALLEDPSRELFLYALREGLVASDRIAVEVDMLPYAAIIEAFASGEYDVVEASPVAVPNAMAGGLELRLFSPGLVNRAGTAIFVAADSPVQAAEDLAGRELGTYSLGGTFMLEARYVLQEGYGLNTDLEAGDLRFREVPPESLAELVKDGSLDAGVFLQHVRYAVRDDPAYRLLVDVTAEFRDLSGGLPMNSILVTYPDVASGRGPALAELFRLLGASADYARANTDEVVAAIAESRGADPGYLADWMERYDLALGEPVEDHADSIRGTWEAARAIGDTAAVPNLEDLTLR